MGTLSIDVPSRSRLDLAGFTGRTMAVAVGACLEASMECLGTLLLLRVVGLGLVASVIECLRTLSFAIRLRPPLRSVRTFVIGS